MRMVVGALVAICVAAAAGPAGAQAAAAAGWIVGTMNDGTCRARLNGPDVDLVAMLNRDGKLVLAAGHAGWDKWGKFDSDLAIDGQAPVGTTLYATGPLFWALIDDPRMRQLRDAQSLDWTLPTGKFHVRLAAFGAAIDGVRDCLKDHPLPAG